jgi:L-ascorbate oxidase
LYILKTISNTNQHWHGLSQRTAPFSDGTLISQWAIAPHRCFDYEIHPEKSDAGTYFYHSHVGFQAISATGPLVIEDFEGPPITYDDERTVFVQDFYQKSDDQIEQGLTAIPFVWSGEVDSVLINGVGATRNASIGQGDCQLPVIDVEPGKIYRVRFVGAVAISLVSLAFEGHSDLEIIAADGHYTKPYPIDHIQLASGQRFDALLRTKTVAELAASNKTDYYIQFETKQRPQVFTGFGILRYPSTQGYHVTTPPMTNPLVLSNNTFDYLEYALEPLEPNNFPKASEVTRHIHINNSQIKKGSIIWQMDGLNWTDQAPENNVPYLVDIYKNGPSAMPNYTAALANNDWDPYTLTWPAMLGEVLEIIIENTGSQVNNNGGIDYHPFHMHGLHYYDCGTGQGKYNATANEEKLANYSPVQRDTTLLHRYADKGVAGEDASWRCWRLRVEAAGAWMMHCHILQHMIMGMQSAWIFGNYTDITSIPYSGAQGYLDYGGNAYGSDTQPPAAYHYYDSQGA